MDIDIDIDIYSTSAGVVTTFLWVEIFWRPKYHSPKPLLGMLANDDSDYFLWKLGMHDFSTLFRWTPTKTRAGHQMLYK